jgi:hypothetical protein
LRIKIDSFNPICHEIHNASLFNISTIPKGQDFL